MSFQKVLHQTWIDVKYQNLEKKLISEGSTYKKDLKFWEKNLTVGIIFYLMHYRLIVFKMNWDVC